ncbi:MAG: disulfide isomerase [Ideonella sp. MAG2]|nr:MAG: disulfide isomerase [Ideonella sp. MAG2]
MLTRIALLSLSATVTALALGAGAYAPLAQAAAPAGYSAPSTTIPWLAAAGDADIEKAFAQGKAEKKPVLVHWGAKWCPPCNQLKATLFNRQDFAERAKHFVAVNIDGDLPGAQKLGSRFKVRGYPTMILFSPDGVEITRLPGEVDAPMVMNVLQMGLAGGRPVKTVLAEARAGKPVTANEWRMLAYYSWDTDEAQLVAAPERPGLLAQLAAACPPAEADTAMRLLLKSLAESDEGKGVKPDAALRDKVRKMLADPVATRAQMDVLVNAAADVVRALAAQPGPERAQMVAAFDAALQRLQADASLSRSDRMSALIGRVELARMDLPKDTVQPKLAPALTQQVKSDVAKADAEITDGYERQAVITSAAHLLGQAGLWKESDALLKANLSKSHSPYYLMSQLGSNAKKQGRTADALDWYSQAFAKSEGPATRLQWGSSYLSALVDMAPQDAKRIEQTASQLITEAANQQGAFYERSARSLQRVGQKLAVWNGKGEHKDVIQRLRQQITPVCAKLPAEGGQKAVCEGVIKA